MTERLFIQIRNGGPFEHPITEWNLRQFYPDLDVENPPIGFEKFERIPLPEIGPYEIIVGSYYEKNDGIWKDVHYIRSLTEIEKTEKIKKEKETFQFADSWSLDEETFIWYPPIEYPEDGNKYYWDNNTKNWVLIPS